MRTEVYFSALCIDTKKYNYMWLIISKNPYIWKQLIVWHVIALIILESYFFAE